MDPVLLKIDMWILRVFYAVFMTAVLAQAAVYSFYMVARTVAWVRVNLRSKSNAVLMPQDPRKTI